MEFIDTFYSGDIFIIFSRSLKQILNHMTKEEIVLGKKVILTRAVTWTNSSGIIFILDLAKRKFSINIY